MDEKGFIHQHKAIGFEILILKAKVFFDNKNIL
jgi:hypothetical protein